MEARKFDGDWTLEKEKYRGNRYWERDLKPIKVLDDKRKSGAIGKHNGEPQGSGWDEIPAGIYEMTLSRYLLERNRTVGVEFMLKMLSSRHYEWAFCQLPGLPLDKTWVETDGKNDVPFLLLSDGKDSFVPGQTKCPISADDYETLTDPKKSKYTLNFVDLIKNWRNEVWEDRNEKTKMLFAYILAKFPHSKVLYINGDYYGKDAYEVGLEEKYYKKSVYDWMNNAVDGEFVVGEESLKDYMERKGYKPEAK